MQRWLPRCRFGTLLLVFVIPAVSTWGDELPIPFAPPDAKSALPETDGAYAVGVRSFYWVDGTRSKSGLSDDDGSREISVTVWYPATVDPGQERALYAPGIETILAAADEVPANRKQFILAHKPLLNVATNAVPAAVPATTEDGWPVILFSPGGDVSRYFQTVLAESIASHGFVFIAMSHPYSSIDVAPVAGFSMSLDWDLDNENRQIADENDNRLADILANDAAFVLMQMRNDAAARHVLERSMDLNRVGIAGHSRGGKTVGRACSLMDEILACAVLDNIGPARERTTGIRQPFLTLRSDWDEDRVAELHDYLGRTGSVSYDVVLRESNHFSCTDMPLFIPELRIDGREPVDQINACAMILTGFFDAFLSDGAGAGHDWIPKHLDNQISVRRFESKAPIGIQNNHSPLSAR